MSITIDCVRTHAAAMPGRTAMGCAETGRVWTWAQFDSAADRLAHWLADKLGIASGARVAVLGRNHPFQLILQYACERAGAIFVPYNWRLAEAEITALMADAEPSLVFHDAEFAVPDSGARKLLLEVARELQLATLNVKDYTDYAEHEGLELVR